MNIMNMTLIHNFRLGRKKCHAASSQTHLRKTRQKVLLAIVGVLITCAHGSGRRPYDYVQTLVPMTNTGTLTVKFPEKRLGIKVDLAKEFGRFGRVIDVEEQRAFNRGVRAGQVIIRIGDTDVTDKTEDEVSDMISKLPRPIYITFQKEGEKIPAGTWARKTAVDRGDGVSDVTLEFDSDIRNQLVKVRGRTVLKDMPNSDIENFIRIANVNEKYLIQAIFDGNDAWVDHLLGEIADINFFHENFTPLMIAMYDLNLHLRIRSVDRKGCASRRKIIEYLLERQDLEIKDSLQKETVFMQAVKMMPEHYVIRDEMMGILSEGCADVNTTDMYGDTPLIFAVKEGDYELTDKLLNYGADVNVVNKKDGRTALDYAILGRTLAEEHGDNAAEKKMVKLLKENGGKVGQLIKLEKLKKLKKAAQDKLSAAKAKETAVQRKKNINKKKELEAMRRVNILIEKVKNSKSNEQTKQRCLEIMKHDSNESWATTLERISGYLSSRAMRRQANGGDN